MWSVRRLSLILLCVRMLMAAVLKERALPEDSDLMPKCPGEQACLCVTASNSCTRCEVNCDANCNDLTTDGAKCFSEFACFPYLLFDIDQDYGGEQCRDCSWGEWGSWSSCSATCGGGTQMATRSIVEQATGGGGQCRGSEKRSRDCGRVDCPTIDTTTATTIEISKPGQTCECNGKSDILGFGGSCQAGPNGAWCYVNEDSSCENKAMFNGQVTSTSACTVKPACGCNGQPDFYGNGGSCQAGPNGAWCYVDVEAGCDNKEAYNGNFISVSPCRGAATHCSWTEWGSWGSCSATCGGGTQMATRSIEQQETGGGEQCNGSERIFQDCGMAPCPTDCVWGEWGGWSTCTAPCGGGFRFSTRHVAQQATGGGQLCNGEDSFTETCNTHSCNVYYDGYDDDDDNDDDDDFLNYYDVGGCLLGFCAGINIG